MRSTRISLDLTAGLAGLVLLLAALPAPAAQLYADVTLTYDAGTKTCSAKPSPVTINWNTRPKKVKWLGKSDLYWDIVWKVGGTDYLNGNFDIKCGKVEKKSTLPGGRDKANAEWEYSIAVYACSGNHRTGEALCEVDPMVEWGD